MHAGPALHSNFCILTSYRYYNIATVLLYWLRLSPVLLCHYLAVTAFGFDHDALVTQ